MKKLFKWQIWNAAYDEMLGPAKEVVARDLANALQKIAAALPDNDDEIINLEIWCLGE